MPILIFSVQDSFCPASETLESLRSRYRSLRISLRKEYIYLVFQETQDLEMFTQDAKEGKLPEFTQQVFEVLGTSEDQAINQHNPSATYPPVHEPQTAPTYKLENKSPAHDNIHLNEDKPAVSLETEENKGTKLSGMVIEKEKQNKMEQNYSPAKQQAQEEQFIPMVEEPTQELQLQFEADPAIVLELPKQQAKQTKEQATHHSIFVEKQQQLHQEIKTTPTIPQFTQLLAQESLQPEEHAEGTSVQTQKITSKTCLNEVLKISQDYQKEEDSSMSYERLSSKRQEIKTQSIQEKPMMSESSQRARNRFSFINKSAYVLAVLTVWILWIVY